MTRSCAVVLVLACAVAASGTLSGCSTVALAGTVHEDAVQTLYRGEPRDDVRKRFGSPASTRALANGWSQDQHEIRVRNDDSGMMGIVDVLALGTLSMAETLSGRPRDPVYRLDVVYDQDARLVCAQALKASRENHVFNNTLRSGTVVGPCPK